MSKNKQEELGGAKTHTVKSGVAHRASENDIEALRDMRALFDFLPLSNEQDPPVRESQDTRDRSVDALDIVIPADSGTPYDMKEVIHTVRTALYCTVLHSLQRVASQLIVLSGEQAERVYVGAALQRVCACVCMSSGGR